MHGGRLAGFTLIELMVALAVFTVLVTVAVPGFRTTIENNRRSNTVYALLGALQLARSEAIKRDNPVSVCAADPDNVDACGNDWASGWLVFSDLDGDAKIDDDGDCGDSHDCIVRVASALDSGIGFDSVPADPITYLGSGLVQDTAAPPAFKVAITRCTSTSTTAERDRQLEITPTGGVHVTEAACA